MANKAPNLRSDKFITEPKNVDQTEMLDTVSHESSVDYNEANTNEEYVTSHKPFGMLGAKGRE